MNKPLTALYDSFYTAPQAADTREEIETIHKQLILKLDKPERRLILWLVDAKDRLAEETSMDSFVCGFRLAWRLANELNNYAFRRNFIAGDTYLWTLLPNRFNEDVCTGCIFLVNARILPNSPGI